MTRTGFGPGGPAGPARVGELLPGQLRQQRGEGAVEDRRVIARRNGVAEHVLGQPQLLERLAVNREL
jgi:hypothetical protein